MYIIFKILIIEMEVISICLEKELKSRFKKLVSNKGY